MDTHCLPVKLVSECQREAVEYCDISIDQEEQGCVGKFALPYNNDLVAEGKEVLVSQES